METSTFDTRAEMARAAGERAAELLRRAIASGGHANVIAATGASQFEFLDVLAAAPGIDWAKAVLFHLDEYVGLPETHPASFRPHWFLTQTKNLKLSVI